MVEDFMTSIGRMAAATTEHRGELKVRLGAVGSGQWNF